MKKHYTVDDLNPRSHAVRDIYQSVKRALLLDRLIHEHLDRCDGDLERAMKTSPATWGSPTPKQSRAGAFNFHRALTEIWGNRYRHHPEFKRWPEMVELWNDDAFRRQAYDAAQCLPRKLKKEAMKLLKEAA